MPREKLDSFGSQRAGEFAAWIPMYMEPQDNADPALFLASDQSRCINGAWGPAVGGGDAA
mgnify:CR=1